MPVVWLPGAHDQFAPARHQDDFLPQALARTIQPLVNIFIACLIGSSLAAAIGVVELTAVTQRINQERAAGVITFLTSGLTYLAIAFAATKVGGLLERRLEFMGRGRA